MKPSNAKRPRGATKPIDFFAARYPNARFHSAWKLLTWLPTGVLDDEGADRTVDFVEGQEKIRNAPFHRFIDMTGYTGIEVELDHIVRLARRRQSYQGPRVRSAFYALRLISVSIARMYEELMQGSQIEVCTFRDRAMAAEWLGVPAELLSQKRA
jgi:hypothetical protein